jgi:4-amino-4-deoxy-L-arabinose transferase-like glycosyltransferase
MKEIKRRFSFLIETRNGEILLVSSLVILVTLFYREIFQYKYTGSDFFAQIAGNSNITKALASPLSPEFLGDTWYRPVDAFTLYLDYSFGGLNAFVYQFTNFVIFIVAILLVYLFVRQIFSDKKLALLSSTIFAFYPIVMHVVPIVTFRAEMLMTVFMILTILLLDKYLKTGNKYYKIFGVISAFLAVCSKEAAIVMMPLLVTFYIIVKGRDQVSNLKKLLYTISPYIASLVFYFILVFLLLGEYTARGISLIDEGISTFIMDRAIAAASFFESMIYPTDVLGLDSYTVINLSGNQAGASYGVSITYVVIAAIALIAVLWVVLYLFKKKIKIRRLFDMQYLKNCFTINDFILFWIASYFAFFIVLYGKFNSYYSFLILAPASVLIACCFLKLKQEKPFNNNLKKILIVIFVIYCIVASPIFANFSNYKTSADIKETMGPGIIDSTAGIPENATIYAIPTYGGVLGEGHAGGIPPHSLAGLLDLEYPDKNWKIIAVSQFTVTNAEEPYSFNYTIELEDDEIAITLNGENVEFYKYLDVYKWFFPVRTNVSISGNLFPYGSTNQNILMESYNLSDYLLMVRIENSRPYVSVISIQDLMT